MKAVKRWRYYCDYCGKVGGHKWHMEKHERGCVYNPNRLCGMCRYNYTGYQGDYGEMLLYAQTPLNKLLKLLIEFTVNHADAYYEFFMPSQNQKEKLNTALERLRSAANGCPACMLAAMVQSKTTYWFDGLFDYKKEKQMFWERNNEKRRAL